MNGLEAEASSYAAVIGLPVDVVRELLVGDTQRLRRARAYMSALGSVQAEGLDPSGIIGGLHAWVLGEVTIDALIASELEQAAEIYGPPSDSRAA
jgi:hypothetical protein